MVTATCVQCGQPIPGTSKMTELTMPEAEAHERNWTGTADVNGTVTVKMCFQCQINRAEAAKERG
jgi:hypothetical protein